MKAKFAFTFFLLSGLAANEITAQCSGCTNTIATTVSAIQYVGPGQTLCISASGNVAGGVVIYGGTVCNQGTISGLIQMSSGTLDNYAMINTVGATLSSGTINNDGTMDIDSLSVGGSPGLNFTNTGNINAINVSISDPNLSGSLVFTNTATGSIVADTLAVTSDLTNNGSIVVNADFAQFSGTMMNNGGMSVGHDFVVQAFGNFYTACMINVGNDFSNLGSVSGPVTGCGGFTVVGFSENSGTFAAGNTNLDMCDQSNPGSFDSNAGTLGANTTYCTCANICAVITGVESAEQVSHEFKVFPNPAGGIIYLRSDHNEKFTYNLLDARGRIISVSAANSNDFQIDLSQFQSGIYFVQIKAEDGSVRHLKFIKE